MWGISRIASLHHAYRQNITKICVFGSGSHSPIFLLPPPPLTDTSNPENLLKCFQFRSLQSSDVWCEPMQNESKTEKQTKYREFVLTKNNPDLTPGDTSALDWSPNRPTVLYAGSTLPRQICVLPISSFHTFHHAVIFPFPSPNLVFFWCNDCRNLCLPRFNAPILYGFAGS